MTTTLSELAKDFAREGGKVLTGLEDALDTALIPVIVGGHLLIDGVPGVAKTLLGRTLARAIDARFTRVQFTPDLMPSDMTGVSVFDPRLGEFVLRRGPIFTNVLLADEINRAPAKTQSALLESMQERSVTLDGVSHPLEDPFLVIATRNPIEHEGTYPLPEASLDRFAVRLTLAPPSERVERALLQDHLAGPRAAELRLETIEPVLTPQRLAAARAEMVRIRVEDGVLDYLLRMVRGTREDAAVALGASPRAAITLLTASRVRAGMRGREYVTPDDVRDLLEPVLAHRLVLDPAAEMEGDTTEALLERVANEVVVPR